MEKRAIILGTYNTALTGSWTLSGLELSSPGIQTYLVEVPGRDGPLDLSAALTGEPRYTSRNLKAVLEDSNDDRLTRKNRIREMVAELDGMAMKIWLPDDPDHYLWGRVRVARNYNDLAHASVTVTAICDPWLYSNDETVVTLTATSTAQNAKIVNSGRMTVVPEFVVTGGPVNLTSGGSSWTLSAGTYQLPDFVLRPGELTLTYSGSGTIKITYREAVLL